MPYSWNGECVESKADKNADILGFGEIGSMEQFVYNHIRFAEYEQVTRTDMQFLAFLVINKKYPPDITPKGDLSGEKILTSLCELARRMDDFEETKSYSELIIEWCKENMHPYRIDYLYRALSDDNFYIVACNVEMLTHDAIFSLDDFMTDLSNLYNVARFCIALDALCYADDNVAYNMYKKGRHFETLLAFERYKHNMKASDIDLSAPDGDLLRDVN